MTRVPLPLVGWGAPQRHGGAGRPRPLNANALTAAFRQSRRAAPKIAALARMGFASSADGGVSFTLRRAA